MPQDRTQCSLRQLGLGQRAPGWDVPMLPAALGMAPARLGSGERACTNIIVVIIPHKYMQALNDLGMEHFLGIHG